MCMKGKYRKSEYSLWEGMGECIVENAAKKSRMTVSFVLIVVTKY